jgi:hypothetical protein
MNKFVDFGKRNVDLPAGCKDLIDVLERAKQRPVPTLTTRSVEGLANAARYLDNLTEGGAQAKNLAITWREGLNYVHLTNERCVITALAVIYDRTQSEQAVREVFEEAGLAPTHDETLAAFSVRLLRYSFPSGSSDISGLISELLRRGYGLAENITLEIGSWEDDAS